MSNISVFKDMDKGIILIDVSSILKQHTKKTYIIKRQDDDDTKPFNNLSNNNLTDRFYIDENVQINNFYRYKVIIDNEKYLSEWVYYKEKTPDPIFSKNDQNNILTPQDIRSYYLWGIETTSSNGEHFDDRAIAFSIDAATELLERELNICIKKKKIASNPQDSLAIDYDLAEDSYYYTKTNWNEWKILLRKKPVIDIEYIVLNNILEEKMIDLKDIYQLDPQKGMVTFRSTNYHFMTSSSFLMNHAMNHVKKYNQAYTIYYNAGYEDVSKIPFDLRDIIGKVSSLHLLNAIGDGLMAGFSSSSLSMDGVHEQFSSTQSATSAYFGARIEQYRKEIQNYIRKNTFKFSGIMGGSI